MICYIFYILSRIFYIPVQKYQKTEGIGNKIQRLNWHSVRKKSSRINQKITQFTGLVSQVFIISFKFVFSFVFVHNLQVLLPF